MTSVGFDALPTQYMNRVTMNGLSFNLLAVGSTGIGKTTLINSLFDFEYPDNSTYGHNAPNVDLNINTFGRPDGASIDLKLTIIETKGFNDQLDKSNSYKVLADYIDAQFERYLQEELKVQKTKYTESLDTRVHCCIYMLAPTGYGLKAVDLVTMKQLHERVCLIPVIAKSDVLTKTERQEFKERIMRDIIQNDIQIYKPDEKMKTQMPFAVSASNEVLVEGGKRIRVRTYPWGVLSIEGHSDFCELRDLVLRNNMLTLVHHTNQIHYERYRREVTSEDRSMREYKKYKSQFEAERADLLQQIEELEKEYFRLTNMKAYATSVYSN